jgi:hypothetical protein
MKKLKKMKKRAWPQHIMNGEVVVSLVQLTTTTNTCLAAAHHEW